MKLVRQPHGTGELPGKHGAKPTPSPFVTMANSGGLNPDRRNLMRQIRS